MGLRAVAFSADLSEDDVRVSRGLLRRVERDLKELRRGFRDELMYVVLGPVCGDDLAVVYVVEEGALEDVNAAVFDLFREYGGEDVMGVSESPEGAGEGPSYAEAACPESEYQDVVVTLFDTYAAENRVAEVAEVCRRAAEGLCYDVGGGPVQEPMEIPGVGYVGPETDDPVLIATTERLDQVGPTAGAILGAGRGAGARPVRRGAPAEVLPGTVIFSVAIVLNGNVIDGVRALEEGTGTERWPLRYL
ncbi:TPA: hypothetical protein HA336_02765 [Methanopyrus kandleri]|uniref:Uncharacterized protein n=1 Tax=Methanopyrus kandleri TaxID=2320 RepID=A0A832TAW2_9EURY|nr:hypothetical protein [Methanopyrus kandleri]HII70141.1 hypothetical protein [Methanopyrus kandleri]